MVGVNKWKPKKKETKDFSNSLLTTQILHCQLGFSLKPLNLVSFMHFPFCWFEWYAKPEPVSKCCLRMLWYLTVLCSWNNCKCLIEHSFKEFLYPVWILLHSSLILHKAIPLEIQMKCFFHESLKLWTVMAQAQCIYNSIVHSDFYSRLICCLWRLSYITALVASLFERFWTIMFNQKALRMFSLARMLK